MRIGNLYVMSTSSLPIKVCNVSLTQSELWHYRMGHPSFTKLSVIRDTLQIDEIKQGELLKCSIVSFVKTKEITFSVE